MASPQQLNINQELLPNAPLVFQQESFKGGMNQQVDPTRLQFDEYPLLINGRTRYGVVEPVELPADADPQGTLDGRKVQGVYSAGPYFIVFADGKCFYKNSADILGAFIQMPGFQMDPFVDTIYAEQVPTSSMNYVRKLDDGTNINGGVNLFTSQAGSPQCLVCQDSINQPRLIFEDGTTRVSLTYDEWTIDNREYIPIGTIMMYLNGILYCWGPVMNGNVKLNARQLFRSVTGRPLDFVVNIDTTGNKGGDASTTSYAVDFDEVTCMVRMNSNVGAFFVSTAKNSYLVTPVLTGLLPFNEPLFTTQPLFNTGPVNNFSLADLVGDAVFIDFGGVRSFNAVLQNRNEGRNLPFSKKVALLFATIIQTSTAAFSFDDYVFFAVDTIYGRGVLVYDTIQSCWVGLDIYDNFAAGEYILQFCEVKVGVTRRLFCRPVFMQSAMTVSLNKECVRPKLKELSKKVFAKFFFVACKCMCNIKFKGFTFYHRNDASNIPSRISTIKKKIFRQAFIQEHCKSLVML